ncbi:MAG: phosphatidate cytidylyltransferase, partial [Campylobacterales bacterium]|nr:phosphatidate cytidylyltransferase [Campylobacterales bacterium]
GWIDSFTLTWLFLGAVYLFAFHEAMRLFGLTSSSSYFWALSLWIIAYFYPNPDDLFFLIAIIFASALAFTQNFDYKLLRPFLYPVSGMLFILVLYKDFGMMAMIWLLVVVALTDVGAFFTGKAIGKHPFCATSPNKTWEGVFGGVILATAVATSMASIYEQMFIADWQIVFLVSLMTSIASVFGDLFESFLKRQAGVKDSGTLLPGHGGVLDRIDGYLFGGIVMVIALRAVL